MTNKMKRTVFVLLSTSLLLASSALATEEDKIVGLWSTPEEDCKIEIIKSGGKYFGRIAWLKEALYPADDEGGMASRSVVDRENPNPNLRSRSLIGLQLMEGFIYAGKNVWEKGTIYNPDNGKTYRCKMTLSAPDRLEVRGFIGVPLLGATSVWRREAEGRDYSGYRRSGAGVN